MPDQDVTPQPAAPVRQPPVQPVQAAAPRSTPANMNAMQQAVNATAPFAQQSAGDIASIKALREKQAADSQGMQKELAAVPETQLPEFHQVQPKDASVFFGAMMALGALAGRSTMTPMTAAMNNMTGIMKAQKEGNAEMLAAQKAEFKTNLDAAIAKARQHAEQRKEILERHNYNMKEADHDLEMLRLEHGVGKDVDNAIRMKYKDIATAADRLQQRHQAMFGGGKASWKPTGKKDDEGHEIYYNAVTGEEKSGKMLGASEKEEAGVSKAVRDLQAKKAAALAKAPAKDRDATSKIFDDQIRALQGGEAAVDNDPLGLMK